MIKCTALKKNQNRAAIVVFRRSRREHITPLLNKKNCRLPVKERILFKIATFAFGFFDGTLPPYLSSCVSVYTPSHTLHSSSDEKTLSSAKWKLEGFGHWSFSVQAPLVWNSLPPHIWHSCSVSQLKTFLKTFLFTSAFSSYLVTLEDLRFFPPHRYKKKKIWNRVECQHSEKRSKTHEIKRTLFNQTEQDKTCKFLRKASFSSYVQQYNRKQLNQLIFCPFDARKLVGGKGHKIS